MATRSNSFAEARCGKTDSGYFTRSEDVGDSDAEQSSDNERRLSTITASTEELQEQQEDVGETLTTAADMAAKQEVLSRKKARTGALPVSRRRASVSDNESTTSISKGRRVPPSSRPKASGQNRLTSSRITSPKAVGVKTVVVKKRMVGRSASRSAARNVTAHEPTETHISPAAMVRQTTPPPETSPEASHTARAVVKSTHLVGRIAALAHPKRHGSKKLHAKQEKDGSSRDRIPRESVSHIERTGRYSTKRDEQDRKLSLDSVRGPRQERQSVRTSAAEARTVARSSSCRTERAVPEDSTSRSTRQTVDARQAAALRKVHPASTKDPKATAAANSSVNSTPKPTMKSRRGSLQKKPHIPTLSKQSSTVSTLSIPGSMDRAHPRNLKRSPSVTESYTSARHGFLSKPILTAGPTRAARLKANAERAAVTQPMKKRLTPSASSSTLASQGVRAIGSTKVKKPKSMPGTVEMGGVPNRGKAGSSETRLKRDRHSSETAASSGGTKHQENGATMQSERRTKHIPIPGRIKEKLLNHAVHPHHSPELPRRKERPAMKPVSRSADSSPEINHQRKNIIYEIPDICLDNTDGMTSDPKYDKPRQHLDEICRSPDGDPEEHLKTPHPGQHVHKPSDFDAVGKHQKKHVPFRKRLEESLFRRNRNNSSNKECSPEPPRPKEKPSLKPVSRSADSSPEVNYRRKKVIYEIDHTNFGNTNEMTSNSRSMSLRHLEDIRRSPHSGPEEHLERQFPERHACRPEDHETSCKHQSKHILRRRRQESFSKRNRHSSPDNDRSPETPSHHANSSMRPVSRSADSSPEISHRRRKVIYEIDDTILNHREVATLNDKLRALQDSDARDQRYQDGSLDKHLKSQVPVDTAFIPNESRPLGKNLEPYSLGERKLKSKRRDNRCHDEHREISQSRHQTRHHSDEYATQLSSRTTDGETGGVTGTQPKLGYSGKRKVDSRRRKDRILSQTSTLRHFGSRGNIDDSSESSDTSTEDPEEATDSYLWQDVVPDVEHTPKEHSPIADITWNRSPVEREDSFTSAQSTVSECGSDPDLLDPDLQEPPRTAEDNVSMLAESGSVLEFAAVVYEKDESVNKEEKEEQEEVPWWSPEKDEEWWTPDPTGLSELNSPSTKLAEQMYPDLKTHEKWFTPPNDTLEAQQSHQLSPEQGNVLSPDIDLELSGEWFTPTTRGYWSPSLATVPEQGSPELPHRGSSPRESRRRSPEGRSDAEASSGRRQSQQRQPDVVDPPSDDVTAGVARRRQRAASAAAASTGQGESVSGGSRAGPVRRKYGRAEGLRRRATQFSGAARRPHVPRATLSTHSADAVFVNDLDAETAEAEKGKSLFEVISPQDWGYGQTVFISS